MCSIQRDICKILVGQIFLDLIQTYGVYWWSVY